MPVEGGDWRDLLASAAAALGAGGVAAAIRSWARVGRIEDRVERLERQATISTQTREEVIRLRQRFDDFDERCEREAQRTDDRLRTIQDAVTKGNA